MRKITRRETNGGLLIELADARPAFKPGDYVEGTVTLLPGHERYESIIVELAGQSWCTVKTRYGPDAMDVAASSALAPVLKKHITLSKEGPVEPSNVPRTFPFCIRIPETIFQIPKDTKNVAVVQTRDAAVGDAFTKDQHLDWPVSRRGRQTLFASNAEDSSAYPLPTSLYVRQQDEPKLLDQESSGEGYIEYLVRATGAVSLAAAPAEAYRGLLKRITSTYPLHLVVPGPDHAPAFDVASKAERFELRTSALAPPPYVDEGGHRSWRDRLSRTLGGTPRYAFYLFVQAPRTLQIGHSEPLPLKLVHVPLLDAELTNLPREACPPLFLRRVQVSLRRTTHLRAVDLENSDTASYSLADIALEGDESVLRPVFLMGERGELHGKGASLRLYAGLDLPGCLDLGARYPMRVGEHGSSVASWARLWPTTRAYNVGVVYDFVVEVAFEVAGKTQEMVHAQPVTVLPVAETQMLGLLGKDGSATMEEALQGREREWVAAGAGQSLGDYDRWL
ncbi:hypothetical protein F4780DRAFT_782852 [Xylariomycetidae sp. FL0641]|nr:hypothetical protein F4780DRAFT_782852 [Xylariomycetidae sp. FL0641]